MLLINRLKGCMYLVRLRSYEKLGGAYPLYKHTRVHVCVHTHTYSDQWLSNIFYLLSSKDWLKGVGGRSLTHLPLYATSCLHAVASELKLKSPGSNC